MLVRFMATDRAFAKLRRGAVLPGQTSRAGLDLYISRLRHRLEGDPREPTLIKTVRSEGYILTADVTLNGAPW
jgi:DNA-binding winged helix-turn-helix (wHTH) protein